MPRLPLEITSPELIAAVCGAIPECTDETSWRYQVRLTKRLPRQYAGREKIIN
ncbi:hypothetical protein [Chromatium okenii]|uniref:hypothetical protein n=1 Tax=Chromatium okenii TaxID=61644 RepID=UPI001558B229|nr:hypothetical protein [Chromatium okenii]